MFIVAEYASLKNSVFNSNVYSMEWSLGVEYWSGVLEWSMRFGVKFWTDKSSCWRAVVCVCVCVCVCVRACVRACQDSIP